ncbi:uncharacterized protein LOC123545274 [Mercenaria mercenaria]|uniref:uncharacterized protein LOC123545274 n=1 Tax=Mercenaria mercenaria TaxID=6596 RepID=UPI00234E4AE5|nr:uncharacterized protein LOC123545274 [Mercenaria mercenaria]
MYGKHIRRKTVFLFLFITVFLLVYIKGANFLAISKLGIDVKKWFLLSQINDSRHQLQTFKMINIEIQKKRKDDIYAYCKATRVPKTSANSTVPLIYNNNYSLCYFDMPKIGSTFIKQMFSVLKHGVEYAKNNFSISRNKVHSGVQTRERFHYNDTLEKTLTIVPVRNPYSRLFSAFIDKVYLLSSVDLRLKIIANKYQYSLSDLKDLAQPGYNYTSELSVTFQDFLDYALSPRAEKNILYDHYSRCFTRLQLLICNSNRYIVVKQESFETDIQHVLQSVGIDTAQPKIYNRIIKSLHESRVEDNIPGIVKVTFHFAGRHAELWNGPIVAERLWHSFQIQGYVSKNTPFPKRYFNSKNTYMNSNTTLTIFLHEMQKGKLSRSESLIQRKEAMLNAYKCLPKSVIRKIQALYDCDFKAFGYDKTLM